MKSDCTNVNTVDEYSSATLLKQTKENKSQGWLSSTGSAYNADPFAAFDLEGQLLESTVELFAVLDTEVVENNCSLLGPAARGLLGFDHPRLFPMLLREIAVFIDALHWYQVGFKVGKASHCPHQYRWELIAMRSFKKKVIVGSGFHFVKRVETQSGKQVLFISIKLLCWFFWIQKIIW